VTSEKEGSNSEFEINIEDAGLIITTPFHPAYISKCLLDKAKKLKLLLTAGVGSDHVDLHSVIEKGGITVAEVTGSNAVGLLDL
jgi:formate dehydrogenase